MEQRQLLFSSASTLARQIRERSVTSTEVVTAFFDQIGRFNGQFNALVTLNRDEAMARAAQADRAIAEGRNLGRLHGVPVTIKDNYRTRGLLTTSGDERLRHFIPDHDAEIVRLLREEGAIILGKTNLSVLAMDMQTDNPLFGRTVNPWDITRTPGGSSGGCATALATGMTPLSFGNDLAGSIRIPGSFCGVYGFKPTYGVVPLHGVQMEPRDPVDGIRALACAGPLARSIDDLELALEVIASGTETFRRVVPLPPPNGVPDGRPLRIAWTDGFGDVPVDDRIREGIRGFVDRLANAGIIVEKRVPELDFYQTWTTWGSLVGMQGNYRVSNLSRWIGSKVTASALKEVPMHQNIVRPTSVEKYMLACERQDECITVMENFMKGYDAFICPVSATIAFRHHAPSKRYGNFSVYDKPLQVNGRALHYYMATQAYTIPFSFTESPVLAMPVALCNDGLPIGVQVVGRRYRDRDLLAFGKLLDQHREPFSYPLAGV